MITDPPIEDRVLGTVEDPGPSADAASPALGCAWSNGVATFGVWAPKADAVEVTLFDPRRTITMAADTEGTWWAATECELGTRYRYTVVTGDSTCDGFHPDGHDAVVTAVDPAD